MRVLHAAVWITDWEPTRSFYVDGLGLALDRSATIDGVDNYVVVGDDGVGIQFKRDPTGSRTAGPAGLDHLAVGVEDVDAVFERLTGSYGAAVGQPPAFQPASGNRIAFVEDPDGYVVELVESTDG